MSIDLRRCRYLGIILTVLLAFLSLGVYMQREKVVTVELDGQKNIFQTRCLTIGDLLREKGLDYTDGDWIYPEKDSILKAGETVVIKKLVPIEIEVDGSWLYISHYADDAGEIMQNAGVVLNPLDRIKGTIDKNQTPVKLSVVRVQEVVLEQEEEVPYSRERILNPQMKRGELKVLQKGEKGLARRKYLVYHENGQEKERKLLETLVIKEEIKEITELGTGDTIVSSSRSLSGPKKEMILTATAYTHTGNRTFTGVYPRIGTIAVDPRVIPLGTRLWVEGYGYGIAQDTGGVIKGNIIDLFMDTKSECLKWGRRKVKVYVLE